MKEFGYNKIFNQVNESMFILNGSGEILFFNKSAEKLQPLLKTKFQRGQRFTDVVSSERREFVSSILSHVKTGKRSQTSEAEYKDDTGRSFYFEVTYHPILNKNNDTSQIFVVSREITHEKTFERKTIELVNELSNLIENANALIFSVDTREYVTEWNKECMRITFFDKNEVLAQKSSHIVDSKSEFVFRNIVARVLEGEAVSNQEISMKIKDGGTIKVLANATPKINSSKNVIGILFVGQDITELSNYRSSLEQKVKDRTEKLKEALEKEKEFVELKNRFVSVASHEFKIPLSSISAAVSAIRKHSDLTATDLKKLEGIEKQAGYMRSLLDDILSLKKSETGQLKPNYSSINIVGFIEKLTSEILDSTQHSHYIITDFPKIPLQIESDEKLLRNIFTNLISNAIKFSPQQKQVEITVRIKGQEVEVVVVDHGIGIEKNDLSRVFEPFNRGSNASGIKGTGLGLSIVKRAIETLGGELAIESEPGKGTTMIVTLKINQTEN
jgi:PAS domain S-box-containing protein